MKPSDRDGAVPIGDEQEAKTGPTAGHTPGSTKLNTSMRTLDIDGQDQIVFEVYTDDDRCQTLGFVFDEKDASLLAAAPETAAERDRLREVNAELLAALRIMVGRESAATYETDAIRRFDRDGLRSHGDNWDCSKAILDFARAALAKAGVTP